MWHESQYLLQITYVVNIVCLCVSKIILWTDFEWWDDWKGRSLSCLYRTKVNEAWKQPRQIWTALKSTSKWFSCEGVQAGSCTLLVGPQPRKVLLVSAVMVFTHLRVKTSVFTEQALEMSDAFTQIELVRKKTLVQTTGCKECWDPSPGEKVKNLHKVCTGWWSAMSGGWVAGSS